MAFHTVEDGPWPKGTTVAAWPIGSVVGGEPTGSPVSTAVASANGVAEFGGLIEGATYVAFGHAGTQTFVAINQEVRLADHETRIDALEALGGGPHTHVAADLTPGTPDAGDYFDGAAGWIPLPPSAGGTLLVSENGGAPSSVDQLDLSPGLDFMDTGAGGKMAVVGEKVWLHQGLGVLPPPTFDNTGDNTAAVNAILTAAATSTGGKPAVVASGPGIVRCVSQVTAPDLVAIEGPANQSLEFLWPSDPGAGNYYLKLGNAGLTGRVMARNFSVHCTDTPNVTSLAPPSRADGVYVGRSSTIENIYIRGNPRYGSVTDSDHQAWRGVTLTGWAAFAFLGTHATYGDYYWDDCQMGGTMTNWYCEQGTQMGGTVRGGHSGFAPIVLMMADGAGSVGLGMRFQNAAIESVGCFVGFDPSGLNKWNVLKMMDCTAANIFDSNATFRLFFSSTVASDTAASGTYSLPLVDATNFPSRGSAYINGAIIKWTGKSANTLTGVTGGSGTLTTGTFIKPIFGDAILRGGAMQGVDLSGNSDMFQRLPQTPAGTILRSTGGLVDVALPNIELMLTNCDAQDVPFGDIGGAISGTTASLNAARVRVKRRRNASPTPRKGDVMRVGLVTGGEYTERFQVIGAAVAGVVAGGQGLNSAATTNTPVLTIVEGMTNGRVQNVGDTVVSGAQSIPTDGAATTTTEDVTLGPIVRTDSGSAITTAAGQTLRVQDPFGLAASGKASLGGKVLTYTGVSGDQLTGVSAASNVGFVDSNVALGRAVNVADASGFSTTGGLGLLGGQLVTYTGKSGLTILGINGGTAGVVSSGATFTPKASLKVGTLRTFIAGVNAIQVGGHLYSIAGFQAEPIASLGGTAVGYLLSPTLATGDAFAGTISNNAVVAAGTQTNGAHGASPATLTVDSTTGFPSKGKVHAPDGAGGLVVGTYTGKTATTFTGCTWSPGPSSIADNQPITVAVGLIVAGDKWVRPAYSTGQSNADDQGLVVEATSNLDSAGEAFAFSMAGTADNGATTPIAVGSRFG